MHDKHHHISSCQLLLFLVSYCWVMSVCLLYAVQGWHTPYRQEVRSNHQHRDSFWVRKKTTIQTWSDMYWFLFNYLITKVKLIFLNQQCWSPQLIWDNRMCILVERKTFACLLHGDWIIFLQTTSKQSSFFAWGPDSNSPPVGLFHLLHVQICQNILFVQCLVSKKDAQQFRWFTLNKRV